MAMPSDSKMNTTVHSDSESDDSMPVVSLPTDSNAYKVDFAWKKFKGVVTDHKTNRQIMHVDCMNMTKPHLKYKGPENELIGTSSFNFVSIHAECEVRGRAKKLQAMKRMTTEYTYLSDAFSDGGLPVPMYWTTSSGFKHWDFILLDSNKESVARFRSNVWMVKKLGLIEFMGDYNEKTKEEITITAITVYYNFWLRMNNIFQLGGAMFSKTGPLDANEPAGVQMQNVPAKGSDGHTDLDAAASSKTATIR